MTTGYNVLLRNAQLDAITTFAGASPLLRIYDGSRPATGGTATTLLAELTMNATSFPAASSGTLTANAITGDTSADADGTATWFRIVKSDGTTHVLDGSVGTSGTDLVLTSTSIVATEPVNVTSLVITRGNA
jgi:hypothetical protein